MYVGELTREDVADRRADRRRPGAAAARPAGGLGAGRDPGLRPAAQPPAHPRDGGAAGHPGRVPAADRAAALERLDDRPDGRALQGPARRHQRRAGRRLPLPAGARARRRAALPQAAIGIGRALGLGQETPPVPTPAVVLETAAAVYGFAAEAHGRVTADALERSNASSSARPRRLGPRRLGPGPRLLADLRADPARAGRRRPAGRPGRRHRHPRGRPLQRRERQRPDPHGVLRGRVRRGLPGLRLAPRRGDHRHQAVVGVLAAVARARSSPARSSAPASSASTTCTPTRRRPTCRSSRWSSWSPSSSTAAWCAPGGS